MATGPNIGVGEVKLSQSRDTFPFKRLSYETCYTNNPPPSNTRRVTGYLWLENQFVFHDPWGVPHSYAGNVWNATGTCVSPGPPSFQATTTDGTGYVLNAYWGGGYVTSTTGEILTNASGSVSTKDRNGNEITVNGSGVFTDTLGQTALTVAGAGTPSSPMTFTYTPPGGGSAAYTVRYTTFDLQTNFGCTGITEYGANGTTTANLVTEIDLPDQVSKYMFTYENTTGHSGYYTGRLASVTLPTGATISYSYGNNVNGITCADGSASTLTRTTPDGTWTYARTMGTGAASATLITAPQLSFRLRP